jgi:hypothetical protein
MATAPRRPTHLLRHKPLLPFLATNTNQRISLATITYICSLKRSVGLRTMSYSGNNMGFTGAALRKKGRSPDLLMQTFLRRVSAIPLCKSPFRTATSERGLLHNQGSFKTSAGISRSREPQSQDDNRHFILNNSSSDHASERVPISLRTFFTVSPDTAAPVCSHSRRT